MTEHRAAIARKALRKGTEWAVYLSLLWTALSMLSLGALAVYLSLSHFALVDLP